MKSREYYKTKKRAMFLGDRDRAAAFVKSQPCSGYMEIADALCSNTFLFNQPWDMEKCREPITFPGKIDWSYVHNNDREWMWMLSRQSYWLCLMQAHMATGEERYLCTLFNQLEQWLDSEIDSAGREYTTWRTLDVGIRLKNWIKILEYTIDSELLDDDLFEKMQASVYKQIAYLMNSYKREYAMTNWRILEFHGTLIASVYFSEFPESEAWIKRSMDILEECIQLQVTSDGIHWEQSNMYHVEMLFCMKDVILVCRRNQIPVPEAILRTTKKLADAMVHLITPAGTQPCYGDSDIEDVREMMAGLGVLLDCDDYRFLGKGCKSVGLVCDYGVEILDDEGWKTACEPQHLDYVHEGAGNYFLRSGWDKEAGYLFFKNGFLGSGHGHCDLLHLELFSRGNPILVDSGRYTYREDTPDRQKFKAAAAHNTLLVDGKECIIQDGSWGNKRTATAIKRPAVVNERVCYLQGAHMGYMDQGILVNRKILYIKPDIWVITDEGFGVGTHTYQQHFHFVRDQVEICGREIRYTDEKQVFTMSVMQNSRIRKEEAELSPGYNTKYRSARVVIETDGDGDTSMTVVGMPECPGRTVRRELVFDMYRKPVSDEFVTCIKIASEEEEWIVFTNHKEEDGRRQIYVIDEHLIYARTAVFHRKQDTTETYVLEY